MLLNENFIVSKFYQYAGYPRYNKATKSYYGGCPTCREGKSWGKKRRLYYIVKKNLVFCHNCGLSMRPIKWIQTVSGFSYVEIMRENNQFVSPDIEYKQDIVEDFKPEQIIKDSTLPEDSINLSDTIQVNFHRNNKYVNAALDLLRKRNLEKAINRPKTFWVSLVDKVHKNRLIIPFYDVDEKIVHYQTRTIIEDSKSSLPKYLSKQNNEKTLFGVNNIDSNKKYIFITEGPLDACFVKNGIAVAGINEGNGALFTKRQQEQLDRFSNLERIWILDNQRIDRASKRKSAFLLKKDEKVFLWPEELKRQKDLNELCIKHNLTEISEKFILDNTYSGLRGNMVLSQLR